jgi:hypothetical protein
MYNYGMRPLLYSSTSGKWRRCGNSIHYYGPIANGASPFGDITSAYDSSKKKKGRAEDELAGHKKKSSSSAPASMYGLHFTHTFEHSEDVCYFAYSCPYTHTDLQRRITSMMQEASIRRIMRRTLLCRSVGQNVCDLLTITAPAISPAEITRRVLVVITCRVHPGESSASWIMDGILGYLSGDSPIAKMLRTLYVFKIVPMLNPDGVINGNYRTSLAGCDLNRRWYRPDVRLHPTIYHTKEMIRRLAKQYPNCILLDLHGHSRKEGIFIFGCMPEKKHLHTQKTAASAAKVPISLHPAHPNQPDGTSKPVPASSSTIATVVTSFPSSSNPENMDKDSTSLSELRLSTRETDGADVLQDDKGNNENAALHSVLKYREMLAWKVGLLPRVLDKMSPLFLLNQCNFKMHRSKASTMRMVNFIELGIDCVYTVEASLAGLCPNHFGPYDLVNFGRDICKSLLEIFPSIAVNEVFDTLGSSLEWSKCLKACLSSSDREPFEKETLYWRKSNVHAAKQLGVSLMSESAINEMISAASERVGRDDDDSDIEEEKQPRSANKKKGNDGSLSNVRKRPEIGKNGKNDKSSASSRPPKPSRSGSAGHRPSSAQSPAVPAAIPHPFEPTQKPRISPPPPQPNHPVKSKLAPRLDSNYKRWPASSPDDSSVGIADTSECTQKDNLISYSQMPRIKAEIGEQSTGIRSIFPPAAAGPADNRTPYRPRSLRPNKLTERDMSKGKLFASALSRKYTQGTTIWPDKMPPKCPGDALAFSMDNNIPPHPGHEELELGGVAAVYNRPSYSRGKWNKAPP